MSAFQRWREARQWRSGRRPRRYGRTPQLFDNVVTLTPLTGYSGSKVPAGSHGTVVDTHPQGSRSPSGYVLEIALAGDGSGVRFDLVAAQPQELIVPASSA